MKCDFLIALLLIHLTLNEFPFLSSLFCLLHGRPSSHNPMMLVKAQLSNCSDVWTQLLQNASLPANIRFVRGRDFSSTLNPDEWNSTAALKINTFADESALIHGQIFMNSNLTITSPSLSRQLFGILLRAQLNTNVPANAASTFGVFHIDTNSLDALFQCSNLPHFNDEPNFQKCLDGTKKLPTTDPLYGEIMVSNAPNSTSIKYIWQMSSMNLDHAKNLNDPNATINFIAKFTFLRRRASGLAFQEFQVRTDHIPLPWIVSFTSPLNTNTDTPCIDIPELNHNFPPRTIPTTSSTPLSTLTSTTTTTPPTTPPSPPTVTPEIIVHESEDSLFNKIYAGCTKNNNCMGETSDCLDHRNCTLLVSWFSGSHYFKYQMFGQLPIGSTSGYVALGLSDDKRMGNDSVVECTRLPNGRTGTFLSWNSFRNNTRFREKKHQCTNTFDLTGDIAKCNISIKITTTGNKTFLLCDFFRKINTSYNGFVFDTGGTPFFLLTSVGTILTEDNIGLHSTNATSQSTIELWKAIPFDDEDKVSFKTKVTKLHGTVMIVVWMLLLPISIFVARYLKETLSLEWKKRPMWWWIHAALHLVGLFLMIISESVKISYFGLLNTDHSIVGSLVCILYILLCATHWYTPVSQEVPASPPPSTTEVSGGGSIDYEKCSKLIHGVVGRIVEFMSIFILMFSGWIHDGTMPCYVSIIMICSILSGFVFYVVVGCHFNWLYDKMEVDGSTDRALNPLPLPAIISHEALPAGKTRLVLLILFGVSAFVWSFILIVGLNLQDEHSDCNFVTTRRTS